MVPLGRLVGGALAVVLVSAMVGFIPSAAGEVTTSPGLSVDPPTGDAGTQVVATATGYDNCFPSADSSDDAGFGAVIFRWEESDQTWTADVEQPGTATQTITVPAAFGPGPHDLVAWCASDDAQRFTDTFTVSSPELPEELEVQPATGPAGTEVQATATGYDSCFPSFDDVGLGTVIFRWEEDDQTWTDDVEEPGTATQTITVPAAFGPGPLDLVAWCASDDAQRSTDTFTVPDVTDPPERLRLEPDTGPAGTEVQATATGYECRGDVVFLAEGDEVARAATREEGTATQTLTVPEDTAAGRYALVAQCETDASQSDAAQFAVTSTAPTTNGNGQQTDGPVPPGPNPPGPVEPSGSAWDPTSWWPAAVLLALLLAVSLQALRLRRGRRWPQMHVHAVPGAAATAGVQTNQTPTDPSSRDVVVRIEPHADPGTQDLKEVDP